MSEAERDQQRAKLVLALAQVSSGRRAGLETVYRMTSAKLFGVIIRIVPDRERAEDVLQDVYVRVWRVSGRFDPAIASPITWLATIARNCAVDEARRKGRLAVTDGQDLLEEIADDSTPVDDMLCEAEAHEAVRRCLDELETEQRKPIRLAFFGGLTHSQLADRIGVPLGTLKSRIRRGLASLKGCLGYGRS